MYNITSIAYQIQFGRGPQKAKDFKSKVVAG